MFRDPSKQIVLKTSRDVQFDRQIFRHSNEGLDVGQSSRTMQYWLLV